MDYTIAMGFISWVILIIFATGFIGIKALEWASKKGETDLQIDGVLNLFHSYNFLGKVNFLLWFGATFWSVVFTIKKIKKE